jgi:hypothetical protein
VKLSLRPRKRLLGLLFVVGCGALPLAAQVPAALTVTPNLADRIERPLRYRPDGADFVIENGAEFFNRPLYGGNTGFRVDAGDKPEFTLYLPGRGGNLRLGFKTAAGTKWLFAAAQVTTRYRPGEMLYAVRDPLLGAEGVLNVAVLALSDSEGLAVRTELAGAAGPVELVWAYGGVNGQRGTRDGDIGTESVPISEYFQLKPEFCRNNAFTIEDRVFTLRAAAATIAGLAPPGSSLAVADANRWDSWDGLLASATGGVPELPVVIGRVALPEGRPLFLGLERAPAGAVASARPSPADELPAVFAAAENHFKELRERVQVETPDPFLNAAVGALNVAADAVWDEAQGAVMHGAVAWRQRLLGWRGPYAPDALGWHDRARRNFETWAPRQNTNPVPEKLPPPEEATNLARSEAALHSNGDLSNSHYDMNAVFIDALFRHLQWTGDLEFARKMWPMIERHLAWERRLFRRPFGPDAEPLYESYAQIWASDDLGYNGGGTTVGSAYNFTHHAAAGLLARRLGLDPAPFLQEASDISNAMLNQLWLADRGWFAEYRDLLGRQLEHPAAGLWTVYHALDSGMPTPMEAWQLTRYVDTQIPHLPVRGPGVPADQPYEVLATTNWLPYSWSINNVVMGENVHTALGYWQAGRSEEAYRLLKSALLASMYLGITPGNVGSMNYLDVYRRESQRDFADGGGVLARAVVEGLFGVAPNLFTNDLRISPAFPEAWNKATLRHPDLDVVFTREGDFDTYYIEPRFERPVSLTLVLPARREGISSVTINGRGESWSEPQNPVGAPRMVFTTSFADSFEVVIRWNGKPPAPPPAPQRVVQGTTATILLPGLEVMRLADVQEVFADAALVPGGFRGEVVGTAGARTVFVRVKQDTLQWWQPVALDVAPAPAAAAAVTDWTRPVPAAARLEPVDLAVAFNDRVTQIFKNEYRAPRSPYVSLATPKQGIGAWAGHVNATAEIDDTGLRAAAGGNGGRLVLPNGVSFATPGPGEARNVLFTSQWNNYPAEATVPLAGRAAHAYLLMAGSTDWMQSQIENGEVVVTYTDGTEARLALNNPDNWWPIEQDYFLDDYQFRRPGPIPPRVDLKTGRVRLLDPVAFKGQGRSVPGGAATVLDLPLDPAKTLQSLTVRALANQVVVGLMAVTLERP